MPRLLLIRVELLDVTPPIWREFQIRATATFAQLHEAIQDACGWTNSHLWMFVEGDGNDIIAEVPDEESEGPPANKVRIAKYLAGPGDHCTYLYDYGDGWDHDVEVVGRVDLDEPIQRRLVAGERAFPPEDCGGVWGYEVCAAIRRGTTDELDLTAEEIAEREQWLPKEWQPDAFDLAAAAKRFDR